MDRLFHARIAPVQSVALVLFAGVLVLAFFRHWALLALVCMVMLVLAVERLIHTTYTLTADGRLLIHRGRFSRQKEAALTEIVSVERVSVFRIGRWALMRYVLVRYRNGRFDALLPLKEDEFVGVLSARMRQ